MIAAFLALSLLVPDTRSVFFGAVQSGTEIAASTPAQVVFLEAPETPVRTGWVAVSTQPWLTVTPESGNGPARLVVQLARSIPAGVRSGDRAQIRIRFADGSPDAAIDASLTLVSGRSAPPVGWVDAPADGFVGTDGVVRISGWALDDVALSRIEICADRPPSPPERRCSDGARALLGEARPNLGARPDVAAVFPSTPLNGRGAWSFVLTRDALPLGRRGTTRVVATAYDSEGSAAILGSRNITLLEAPTQRAPVRRGLVAVAAFLALHAVLRFWLLRNRPAGSVPGSRPAIRLHPAECAVLVAALVTAAALDANGLSRGFTYDEMFSASHFIVDTPLLTAATRTVTFNNHYAYSLLSGVAARLFGHEEWAIRIPAVLLGVTAIGVSWALARWTAGPTAGLATAVVLALMPGFVEWSHSARGYSGLALMTVSSTYCFARAVRTGSRRAAAWHALTVVLAFYFHLYAVWLLAIQYGTFAMLAISERRRHDGARYQLGPLWWSFCAAVIGTFILYLPMLTDLAALMQTRQRTDTINTAFPVDLLHAYVGPVPVAVLLILAVLFCAGLQRLWRTLEGWLLGATLLAPALLVWLVVRPVDLHTRYLAFVMPVVAIVVGTGAAHLAELAVRRPRRSAVPAPLLPTAAVAMALLALPAAAWVRIGSARPADAGYREALRSVGPRTGPIVFVGADAEMFDYYLGKPLGVAHLPGELDQVMRAESKITVVYHDVAWNSPGQRQIAELLRRRCEEVARGPVVRFSCH